MALTFREAVLQLAAMGIKGSDVYLIDLVLLCEMSWADGMTQKAEREIINEYLCYHVNSINRLAGCIVLKCEEAQQFIGRFLDQEPDNATFEKIRELLPVLRLQNKGKSEAETIRMDILNACLDIAASSVTRYPYGSGERFTEEEKEYYHKLVEALTGKEHTLLIA